MREELKDFTYHVYGLSLDDYDYTVELTKSIIESRYVQLREMAKEMDANGDDTEAIDDCVYYPYIELQYLYHFVLWRLQGIFEGIVKKEFFNGEEVFGGIKKKLNKLRGMGIKIADEDYNEILIWASLRNSLSHNPPEQYRPSGLNLEDVQEYKELLNRVTTSILEQK